MALMDSELYNALKKSGVPDADAQSAAISAAQEGRLLLEQEMIRTSRHRGEWTVARWVLLGIFAVFFANFASHFFNVTFDTIVQIFQ